MRALVVLACLAGCGRIGFDAGTEGGGSGGSDGGDDAVAPDLTLTHLDYIKPNDPFTGANFGSEMALSADGTVLAVGAFDYGGVGAVYVFRRTGDVWAQEARLTSLVSDAGDHFGTSVSISGDGTTIAIGAYTEASGNPTDDNNDSAPGAGAVYVFTRVANAWGQRAYVKPFNPGAGDGFGGEVTLSQDGTTLAVGAPFEDSSLTGVQTSASDDNSATDAGAAYVFVFDGTSWSSEAYIKATNTDAGDRFGSDVTLSATGDTLVVGAPEESSSSRMTPANNNKSASGAAYVYQRTATTWAVEQFVKANEVMVSDTFANSLALSADAEILASADQGVNAGAGEVLVFSRDAGAWTQSGVVKASSSSANDHFGHDVVVSSDGSCVVAIAPEEDGAGEGIDPAVDDNALDAGAAYVFRANGGWHQAAYLKPTNTRAGFGVDNAAVSADCSTIALASFAEDSGSPGVNGDGSDTSRPGAGAVYIFR